jgi:hypothetical protein
VQGAHEVLSDIFELSCIVQNLSEQLLYDLHALQGLFVVHPSARLNRDDKLLILELLGQNVVE